MTGLSVTTRDLAVRYRGTTALEGVNLDLAPGRIHGLLGRNGAGKTTLLSVLGSMQPQTSGEVLLDGAPPFEDERLMEATCLVRETGDQVGSSSVREALKVQDAVRPTFDREYAEHLLERFGVAPKTQMAKLSRGKQSVVGAVLGLASRAPLTMLDEVHLGMDAPTREEFSSLLLEDFVEQPRTIILSSHLIAEVEHLLETVTILHEGRVLLSAEADDLRARGMTITGRADLVDEATRGLRVIGTRDLGPTRQVTVFGEAAGSESADSTEAWADQAQGRGLQVGPVPLQDLFIHLTGKDAA